MICLNRSWMYNCLTRRYTVVDEMSVDEMSADELSWNRWAWTNSPTIRPTNSQTEERGGDTRTIYFNKGAVKKGER